MVFKNLYPTPNAGFFLSYFGMELLLSMAVEHATAF